MTDDNTSVEPDAPQTPAQKAGFKSSLDRTKNKSPFMKLFGFLSSLWSAAILIALLAFVTAIATYYEGAFGMEVVAVKIYHSWWFTLIFALLAINIFGAAAVRYPWKKRQTGFVITHAGLLTIMAGFVVAGNNRLDGILVVPQGENASRIELPREALIVVNEATGERVRRSLETIELADYPGFWSFTAQLFFGWAGVKTWEEPIQSRKDLREHVGNISGHPMYIRRVVDTAAANPGPSRVSLEVKFSTANDQKSSNVSWLPQGHSTTMGPLLARFLPDRIPDYIASDLVQSEVPKLPPMGQVVIYQDQSVARIPVTPSTVTPLSDTLAIRFGTYVPHVVKTDSGFTQPDKKPLAPVLIFQLGRGPADNRVWGESLLLDGLDPNPNTVEQFPDMYIAWQHPTIFAGRSDRQIGSQLDIVLTEGGALVVRRFSNKNGQQSASFADENWNESLQMPGGELAFGFNDVEVHAQGEPQAVAMEPSKRDRASNWIELQIGEGSEATRSWLQRDSAQSVTLDGGATLLIRYEKQRYDLADQHGFTVNLERFINDKDPGGTTNATFQSVININHADKTDQHIVSMNEPVAVAGVSLYQTARQPLPDGRFISFFTVAQDPGRVLKYIGSALLIIGIATMYIMRMGGRKTKGVSS